MKATGSSKTSVIFNGLHGVIPQKIELFPLVMLRECGEYTVQWMALIEPIMNPRFHQVVEFLD
jgi:hypothetical protein